MEATIDRAEERSRTMPKRQPPTAREVENARRWLEEIDAEPVFEQVLKFREVPAMDAYALVAAVLRWREGLEPESDLAGDWHALLDAARENGDG